MGGIIRPKPSISAKGIDYENSKRNFARVWNNNKLLN
jgi:hypothetical protein